jgi:hypothetical protein
MGKHHHTCFSPLPGNPAKEATDLTWHHRAHYHF